MLDSPTLPGRAVEKGGTGMDHGEGGVGLGERRGEIGEGREE
jgi:hypothetical protein